MAESLGYEQITATALMAPGLFVVALSSQNGVIVILESNGDWGDSLYGAASVSHPDPV